MRTVSSWSVTSGVDTSCWGVRGFCCCCCCLHFFVLFGCCLFLFLNTLTVPVLLQGTCTTDASWSYTDILPHPEFYSERFNSSLSACQRLEQRALALMHALLDFHRLRNHWASTPPGLTQHGTVSFHTVVLSSLYYLPPHTRKATDQTPQPVLTPNKATVLRCLWGTSMNCCMP